MKIGKNVSVKKFSKLYFNIDNLDIANVPVVISRNI